jgi:acetyl-CoA acetyltransferase
MRWEWRGRSAIAGVGRSELGIALNRSTTSLAAEAFKAALADAGLDRHDVDGLYVNAGPDVDQLAELLGLSCRFANQSWRHGRLSASIVQAAGLAVAAGLADCVACIYAIDMRERGAYGGDRDLESLRAGGGPHHELPHYGLTSPGSAAALAVAKYMDRYGMSSEQLGIVAVSQRAHALRNPDAVERRPLTLDEYGESPYIIEPLRRADFCLTTDGAACVLVTTADRARALRKPPVYILGAQGLRAGREEFIFGRRGLGLWQQTDDQDWRPQTQEVYVHARLARDEVQGLYIYDSFSPQVIFALEEFGFCGAGEGGVWIADGHSAPDGRLPINTHGGHLSEAMLAGWGHQIEIVTQLRGEAGERQITGAQVLQYVGPLGVSIIYGTVS